MLSHPNPNDSEVTAVAAATSPERPSAGNHRRHPKLGQFIFRFNATFFRDWFVEGPRRLLRGGLSTRGAAFMIIAALPAILGALFLTLPGMIFDSPFHEAYYHFARGIREESLSTLPLLCGAVTTLFSFRFPLAA